ncbi:MAG: hypothetical protein HY660_05120 [Armatimonadetes bacterium]|nr:hypothetical protein [Armatimonadota bacterium]
MKPSVSTHVLDAAGGEPARGVRVEVSFEAENHPWDTARVSDADPLVKVYTDPRPPYGVIGLTLRRESRGA